MGKTKTPPPSQPTPGFFEGFAGTTKGSFFEAPSWVDKSLPAGHTPQNVSMWDWPKGIAKLTYMFYSPNLVWCAIAILIYVLVPYDFDSAREGWSLRWIWPRALVNTALVLGYFGFWHVTLYWLGWGERKFRPDRRPGTARMIHNVGYSVLGALQWTAWEVIFIRMYATGKIPHIADSEAFATPGNIARMILWTFGVPLVRDIHFYFAHRFIHMKCLYNYVHSLHHRNTDIEPFAGLCMHPIEHLYYYSCIFPSLYFYMSPFHFWWNGCHLLISPAASHSGWEDNFQSDQYHYLHHAMFECNYGTGGLPFDIVFGTYREKIGTSKTYKGEFKGKGEALEKKPAKIEIKKDVMSYKEYPYFNEYLAISCVMFAIVALAVAPEELGNALPMLKPVASMISSLDYRVVPFMMAYGPVFLGILMLKISGDKSSLLWPFHKEGVIGSLGFHLFVGWLISALPVYHSLTSYLGPEAAYCDWNIFAGC